jgi:GT2 family glycosyltransferase
VKASIIVPNLEPQAVLLPSIQALCSQTVSDYEVLFPAWGLVSREEKAVLKHFEEEYPNFRVVQGGGGRSNSLNKAAETAEGKLLFFVESHCLVDNGWLKRYLDRFNKERVQVSFMGINEVPSDIWTSKLVWRQRTRVVQRIKDGGNYDAFFDLHGSGIRRDFFEGMGFFDPEIPAMAEFEFGARLHQKGVRIYRVPDEEILHFNNRSLSSYEMIVKRQGLDRTRMLRKYGRSFMEKYFPSPNFIRLLPWLGALRIPALCATQVFMAAQHFGFRAFEKSAPGFSEGCFRGYAANCLRYGMLKGLGRRP